MTRLTEEMILEFGPLLANLDQGLIASTGLGLRGLALSAVGLRPGHSFAERIKVAAVPIDSGQGRISGFSNALADVARHLGFSALVTEKANVAGIRQAYGEGADVIMMADDEAFIAVDTHYGTIADNAECTAMGYVEALRLAAGGFFGKKVLVIGAGQVGTAACHSLRRDGALVCVAETDMKRKQVALGLGFDVVDSLDEVLSEHHLVLNASPASLQGLRMAKGTILSNPGVPLGLDDEARSRCRNIIHDPLAIGTAVMIFRSLTGNGDRIQGQTMASQ